MLAPLLLFILACAGVAELSDESDSNPSCLLQTNRQIPPSAAVIKEQDKADQADLSSSAQQAIAFDEMSGTAGKPNGPADMHKTKMSQDDLPTGSRHVNKETYSSDWSSEYRPFVRETIPSIPAQPVEPGFYWAYWLFLLALCCLLMVCCCAAAFLFSRRQKRESFESAPSAAICALPNHPFFHAYQRECMLAHMTHSPQQHAKVLHTIPLPSHDDLLLAPQTLPPRHFATETARVVTSPMSPGRGADSVVLPARGVSTGVPVATVGVDRTGDGRVDYMYTGIDSNNDGIPDSLQSLHVGGQVHTATVAVDARGDGHADYLYTGLDLNNDGIPDSLQGPNISRRIPTATVALDPDLLPGF